MTEKKNRRCPNCTRYNVNCREPNRVTPKYATECRKYSEKPQKPIKCRACDGKGLLAFGENIKGLQKCPVCKGTGIIDTRPISFAEFCGTEVEFVEK